MGMKPNKFQKITVTIEEYSQGLYQIACGAAAKAQQELTGQPGLVPYKEKVDNATLGLLASGLWLANHLARLTIAKPEASERCVRALETQFFQHIESATSGQFDRRELQDYLNQLHSIYSKAWNNQSEPGRSWWLAQAMAREILDTPTVPELATVIMVGEVESTLAMGSRLTKQYFISWS